jgi:hypothetical protein
MKPVKVATAMNSAETGLIMNLLMNNEIPCFKKDIGPGGWMNVKYGFSVYGEEIYVDVRDYEKASIIIGELSPEQSPEFDQEADPEADNKDDGEAAAETGKADSYKNYPFYRNPRILARIFIITQIVIALLVYLITRRSK